MQPEKTPRILNRILEMPLVSPARARTLRDSCTGACRMGSCPLDESVDGDLKLALAKIYLYALTDGVCLRDQKDIAL